MSLGRRNSTIRNDCLIATQAILAGIPLLHRDRDFDLIAGVEPKLMLVAARRR
jgi:predicted nucleic acid-binding protein